MVDGTDATAPDSSPAGVRNRTIPAEECDSVSSVVQRQFAQCYRAEKSRLVRYLMKCFKDSDMRDADDAAQTAFTELLENWSTVRNPPMWLRTVAFRQMLRQHARPEYPLDKLHREPHDSPASARLELREEEQTVMNALRQLPLSQRQVLALLCDEFNYREIAELMNISEAAVRQNAKRARTRMKELLGIA